MKIGLPKKQTNLLGWRDRSVVLTLLEHQLSQIIEVNSRTINSLWPETIEKNRKTWLMATLTNNMCPVFCLLCFSHSVSCRVHSRESWNCQIRHVKDVICDVSALKRPHLWYIYFAEVCSYIIPNVSFCIQVNFHAGESENEGGSRQWTFLPVTLDFHRWHK